MQSNRWWFETLLLPLYTRNPIALPVFELAKWLNLLGFLLMPHLYSYDH